MAVNVQCGAGLCVSQQACHSAYIYTLSNEHAGVCMPQAVHVQIVRQIALLQNLFEPECECTRHPRIPAGLPKQIVLFLQPPFTTLLFLPRTFLTGSERHTSLSSVFGFGLPHAGQIPFTRYFERDFSRYYGLLFRFLLEAKAHSGQFIFDCAFWGWRHLACRLFRVGTLEFEYRPGRFKRTASARHCSTLPCSVRIHSLGCPPFRSCAARFLRTGRALLCSARFVFV